MVARRHDDDVIGVVHGSATGNRGPMVKDVVAMTSVLLDASGKWSKTFPHSVDAVGPELPYQRGVVGNGLPEGLAELFS